VSRSSIRVLFSWSSSFTRAGPSPDGGQWLFPAHEPKGQQIRCRVFSVQVQDLFLVFLVFRQLAGARPTVSRPAVAIVLTARTPARFCLGRLLLSPRFFLVPVLFGPWWSSIFMLPLRTLFCRLIFTLLPKSLLGAYARLFL
jgi:hypothetical protein